MRFLALFALVQRFALILKVTTTEAVGTQTLRLHYLHLLFGRHGLELGTSVERVLLGYASWTAAAGT